MPIVKRRQLKPVSVLIAVHNGDQFIGQKLESDLSLAYPPELIEMVIVSDDSYDRSASLVQEFASDRLRLVEVQRSGKCAALNQAVTHSKNEMLGLDRASQIVN